MRNALRVAPASALLTGCTLGTPPPPDLPQAPAPIVQITSVSPVPTGALPTTEAIEIPPASEAPSPAPLGPPAAPVIYQVTAGDGAFAVTWEASPGADRYRVTCAEDASPAQTLADTVDRHAAIFNLSNDTPLTCTVAAVNAVGETASSPFAVTPRAVATTGLGLEGVLITAFDDASVAGLNDPDAQTPWSSTRPQTIGDWVEIDLGDGMPLNRIVVDAVCRPTDAASALVIMTSPDRAAWTEVARWSGPEALAEIRFAPLRARHWRVVVAAPSSAHWAICRLILVPAP